MEKNPRLSSRNYSEALLKSATRQKEGGGRKGARARARGVKETDSTSFCKHSVYKPLGFIADSTEGRCRKAVLPGSRGCVSPNFLKKINLRIEAHFCVTKLLPKNL